MSYNVHSTTSITHNVEIVTDFLGAHRHTELTLSNRTMPN